MVAWGKHTDVNFSDTMRIIMTTLAIQNQADMGAVVRRVLEHVNAEKGAAVVALHGELGAGKTTFVQMLAKALGVNEAVTSPTFVVMKRYELPQEKNDIKTLVHIDAYRIEDENEMTPLRFTELLATPGFLICIEWAEKIKNFLPKSYIDVTINITNQDGGREVIIHGA